MYYYAIILKEEKRNLVIPSIWCPELSNPSTINHGLQKTKKLKIFYSPDEAAAPDFTKPINTKFTEGESSCYWAYVLKCFGKHF